MKSIDAVLADTQADLFWLPPGVTRLDRPDVLALHDGSERDLTNQVVRTSTTDDAVPALIEEISAFHTSTSQWLVVPPGNGDALETHLPDFDYEVRFQADGYSTPSVASFAEGDVRVVEVVDLAGLRDNIAACAAGFDRAPKIGNLERELALCVGPAARSRRFVAYDKDGQPVGSANINLYRDLRFAFLWAGAVVPEARGRGVYRALLGERCRWAAARGMERVGLYAKRDTSGPVVASIGFEQHGPMAYWQRR